MYIMIGIEMKLNIPVHYQMGDPVICISRVICSLISDTKKSSVQHPWAVLSF
jgi:hypothetical protein